MTAADRRESTVVADVVTAFGGSVVEDPEPLESTDRFVDRIRADLAEASTPVWQLGFNS